MNENSPVPMQTAELSTQTHAGALSAAEAAKARVMAMVSLADARPRDLEQVYANLQRQAQRPSLAKRAGFSVPRAGGKLKGASVHLLRMIASEFKHLSTHHGEVPDSDGYKTIFCEGYDAQNNRSVRRELRFKLQMYRKGVGIVDLANPTGNYARNADNDIRSLTHRNAAFLLRAVLEELLPRDIIDETYDTAMQTHAEAVAGTLKKDPTAALRSLAAGFAKYGVTVEMLAGYLDHPWKPDLVTAEEYADLVQVGQSLRDGLSTRGDHFDVPKTSQAATEDAQKLEEEIAAATEVVTKAPNENVPPGVNVETGEMFSGGEPGSYDPADE